MMHSAASGFGHAFAKRAVQENMKLVLADLNYDALVEKSKELNISPDRVCFVKCDVSRSEDIQRLADTAFSSFGGVHLLFNNAGVAHAQLSWEHTEDGEDLLSALYMQLQHIYISVLLVELVRFPHILELLIGLI
jgi:NAD(P)-dependent dehydrogenase (short-subunit alcohol dehydrogenase family)